MTAPTLNNEFATGTGRAVLVDRRGEHNYVHVDMACSRITRAPIGQYPTEKVARAAVPGCKPCKACRPS